MKTIYLLIHLASMKRNIISIKEDQCLNTNHVNLILISNEENSHYLLIKFLSLFTDKKNKGKTYPC